MRKPRSNAARRGLTVVALTAVFLFAAVAARPLPAENIDLVVMVDTSESMFPYFDDLMNYLVQDLLVAKLHRGDTFHLLSFSSVPEVEISLEVNSEEAAQRAFGRILLLHALGRYTDLVSALQFLNKYTKELPETNPKQIILITDGVNDPPPDSPNHGSPEKIRAAVLDAAQAMKKEGWTFNILRVPPEPAPGEEGLKSYLPDLAEALGVPVVPYKVSDKEHVTGRTTGFPNITFPANLGKVPNRFIAPFKVKNWKGDPIIVRLTSIQGDGMELLEKKVTITVPAGAEVPLDAPIKLPLSFPRGERALHVQLLFADELRISPTAGTLSFTYTGKGGIPIPRLTFLYVLYIVLAGALIYGLVRLFLFMRKTLSQSAAAGIARRAPGARTAP
ncbi:MAG: vWA domain-containing protein, partial [Spirochaetia bacterium]